MTKKWTEIKPIKPKYRKKRGDEDLIGTSPTDDDYDFDPLYRNGWDDLKDAIE